MKKGNFYTDLPPWGKFVVIMAGTAITLYTAHFIYQKIQTAKNDKSKREENKTAKDEIKNLADKGIKPTISEAHATILSNQLFASMDGLGTYIVPIKKVIEQLKNDADYYMVSVAFGIKSIRSGVYFVSDKKYTLSQALTDELGEFEQKDVNAMLKKQGLTIQV